MKFKILSKKGAAVVLSMVLAFGSIAVFAQESTFSSNPRTTASDQGENPTKPDPTKPDPTKPDPTKPDPTKPDPTKPDPTKPDPVIAVSKVTLNKTATTLEIGKTETLTAKVDPDNATNKDQISWNSTNTGVATVANGVVTAKAAGTTQVTATVDGVKSNVCTVTVKAATPPAPTTVSVTGVSLNKKSATVVKGKTVTLKATVKPGNATNKSITWSSSDKKVATVDKNGKVKGVKAGTATITAKTSNNKKATCKVTVAATTAKGNVVLKVKQSVQLKNVLNIYPTSDKISKCSVDKKGKNFVKVTNAGKVTAQKKTGKAKVTVTMKSGAKATVNVTVQNKKVTTKKITVSAKNVNLNLKKTKKATVTVTRNPVNATEKITAKANNKNVTVKVSKDKITITAKKAGKSTITVKTSNGKSVKITVTVKKK